MQYVKIYQDVQSVLEILKDFVPHTARPVRTNKKEAGREIKVAPSARVRSSLASSIRRDNLLSNRSSSDSGGPNDVVRGKVCFNSAVTLTGTTASVGLEFKDNMVGNNALLELGKVFRYYRFNRIMVHFPAPCWTTADMISVAYVPSGIAVATGPLWDEVESEHQMIQSQGCTVEKQLVVPRSALNPQHEWFLTQGDGTEPNADIMGIMLVVPMTASAEDVDFQVTLEYEFCSLLDPVSLTANFDRLALERKAKQQGRSNTSTTSHVAVPSSSERCGCSLQEGFHKIP